MESTTDNGKSTTKGPIVEEHQTNGKTWRVRTYGAGTSKPPISFMPRSNNLPGFDRKGAARSCSQCGFEAFGWSKECSKCGEAL